MTAVLLHASQRSRPQVHARLAVALLWSPDIGWGALYVCCCIMLQSCCRCRLRAAHSFTLPPTAFAFPIFTSIRQVQELQLEDNDLSGPAFPPAWLQPGSLPKLSLLILSDNPGLTGTLPASLPWPTVITLWATAADKCCCWNASRCLVCLCSKLPGTCAAACKKR